ncbi:ParA family partition ATPase [Litoreibacter roseus]|uniref:Cobyrinic acid a,c-diamide synthase n=1 Tax=Litoreibacter roseus TaxID=2601869 RepID=A0A6N6J9Y1_9RHOB|nr:ParA family partition ATPase [Litoreibacter roseus]GFE62995.1 cobyrinic acid a,c-diamide synthase [Litoreibacter roseus]
MTGKIITVAQQKGGSGKTTLSAGLAMAAVEAGKSVAIIDSDPQGSLGRWFMARHEAGRADGVNFSTASAWGIAFECDKLKADHDLVIVDTPPKVDADLRPAFRASDLIIVPVSASQVDVWATESVLELAEREDRPAMVVLNRARSGTRLATEIGEAISGMPCITADTVISNRVVYAEAMGQGKSVGEAQRTGPAAQEMRALSKEVFKQLGL